jgi:hypothetical protein
MTAAFIVALTVVAQPGMLQFVSRVHDYVETHRRVAVGIEQPLCSDPEELFRQAETLAAAIREARPRAKEGDIFSIAAADLFRARIEAIVRRSVVDVAPLLAREEDEGEELELHVFGTLPWRADMGPWMPIVRELPELPQELEYRFVGRHLVLMDVRANLVVDVLRDALPLPAIHHPSPRPRTFCDVHPELDACWM